MKKVLLCATALLLATPALGDTVKLALNVDGDFATAWGNAGYNYQGWSVGGYEDQRGFFLRAYDLLYPSHLTLAISSLDNTTPYPLGAQLQMDAWALPPGWTEKVSLFYDEDNTPFDGVHFGELVASHTFTSPADLSTWLQDFSVGPDPWSATAVFDITASGPGYAGTDVNFGRHDVLVPGPIVGTGLPALLVALGGLVALARRRQEKVK